MLRNYLILSWKILSRRKFFTFISLFGIALTLMVLMLTTAFLDHAFGAVPPEIYAARTLGVYSIALESENNASRGAPGFLFLDRHVRTLPDVEEVTIASIGRNTITYAEGERVPLVLKHTDGAFWRVLSFEFLEGGPFTDHDNSEATPVAVISQTTRRRVFGEVTEDRGPTVGRSFEVDGQRFRVIGVVADVSNLRMFPHADVWVPLTTAKGDTWRHSVNSGVHGGFRAQILAHHKDDLPRIRAEYAARLENMDLSRGFGDYEVIRGAAETHFEAAARGTLGGSFSSNAAPRLRLMLIFGALLFMALPSLNMININISRILERASEIGVRKSFGASSWVLVGQFVVENLLLSLLGGVVGLGLTSAVLLGISKTELVAYADITMNLRVFAFGLMFTVIFGLLSGAYPAWKMSRLHPVDALKESAS